MKVVWMQNAFYLKVFVACKDRDEKMVSCFFMNKRNARSKYKIKIS